MKAVTRSEHKRKELIICVLQHISNLEELGGTTIQDFAAKTTHDGDGGSENRRKL